MRKNALIKYLQGIKDNPEVVLWNGFVEDYMPIAVVEPLTLYREDREHVRSMLNHSLFRTKRAPVSEEGLEEAMQYRDWELPNSFYSEEQIRDYYKGNKKTVLIIEAGERGKSIFDRRGTVRY
jgi:hypothetical protein